MYSKIYVSAEQQWMTLDDFCCSCLCAISCVRSHNMRKNFAEDKCSSCTLMHGAYRECAKIEENKKQAKNLSMIALPIFLRRRSVLSDKTTGKRFLCCGEWKHDDTMRCRSRRKRSEIGSLAPATSRAWHVCVSIVNTTLRNLRH